MTKPIYKLVIFMSRRPDVTPEAFRDYYESTHAKMGERIASQAGACRYVRRYVERLGDTADTRRFPFPYDVITEVWFEDRQIFEQVAASVSADERPEGIAEDEEQFMDRSMTRFVTVVECESDL